MPAEIVEFYSAGIRLVGTLKLPDEAPGPVPAIVHGPGWLGLRDAKLYEPYHDACLAAGIAVLVFDHRGFGDSGGDPTLLDIAGQVEDYRAAATYLETRTDIAHDRLGVFGSGGTGGGNALMAAGLDPRFKAVVSQVPIADGADWLHRMRPEHEWLAFLDRLEADRHQRVLTGQSELVSPRNDIMVPTPERRTTAVKSDVDGRVPSTVQLASADRILEYRPIDVVDRITPRAVLIICVERDATTPTDHAWALYERAGAPKRLVVQTGTTHYAAYERYRHLIAPMIVDWFCDHLVSGDIRVHDTAAASSVVHLTDR